MTGQSVKLKAGRRDMDSNRDEGGEALIKNLLTRNRNYSASSFFAFCR